MKIGFQVNNGFLPARCHTNIAASSARLTYNVSCPYLVDLYAVQSLDRISYLNLISLLINLKAVRTSDTRQVHSLLCYYRPNYYLIIIHVVTR